MRNGILITARLGSTRLARKHMLQVDGKPIFYYLVKRIMMGFKNEIKSGDLMVAIATTMESDNKEFELFRKEGVSVFYGDKDNVLLRHLQAAQYYSLDNIISVDGDDVLCSIKAIKEVYDKLRKGVCYVKTSGLPLGFNSIGYSKKFLESSLENHKGDVLDTGWGRIFDESKIEIVNLPFMPFDNEELRFTLDYQQDYDFFKSIISHFEDNIYSATDADIVKYVITNKLYEVTAPITKKYWEEFYKNMEKDESKCSKAKNEVQNCDVVASSGQILYKKALERIPGGTQLLSKRPEMYLPKLWPSYYRKAKGVELWDLDGCKYTDMSITGVGACVLGYADSDVDGAVKQVIEQGTMSTLNCPEEVELAELLCELHPWAEMVRFTRCGGESVSVAVRIARAYTGRDKVAFCGYHGWHDWYLSANLADDRSLDGHLIPGLEPAGVPRNLKGTAIPFGYNKCNELNTIVDSMGHEIAAIVMEPVRHHEPEEGFLSYVREVANKIGAVLIFDEITSGWRMNTGGIHLLHGVNPDIAVFAKGMSNGYPMGAIIGIRAVMQAAQKSFISSTYWTERIGPTAAIATIKKHRSCNVSKHLCAIGQRVQEGWNKFADYHKLKVLISGISPLSILGFDYGEQSQAIHTLFTQAMLDRGFLASKAFYASYAHKNSDIDRYFSALDEVFSEISQAIKSGDVTQKLRGPVAHSGFKRLA